MTAIQGFELLTGVYLGQDWDLFGKTVDDAIVTFVEEEDAADVSASVAGFEGLLASDMSEQEYYNRWVFGLDSGYDPRDDGYTFREWFTHALGVLRTAVAPLTPDLRHPGHGSDDGQ